MRGQPGKAARLPLAHLLPHLLTTATASAGTWGHQRVHRGQPSLRTGGLPGCSGPRLAGVGVGGPLSGVEGGKLGEHDGVGAGA